MVGVFDHSTNELTLRHAPLYVVRHQVKALKDLGPILESGHDYQHARNVLGKAFGTKKAKAAIRAAEKNKVDVAAMKDVRVFAGPLFLIPTIFSGRRYSSKHHPIKNRYTSKSRGSQRGSRQQTTHTSIQRGCTQPIRGRPQHYFSPFETE